MVIKNEIGVHRYVILLNEIARQETQTMLSENLCHRLHVDLLPHEHLFNRREEKKVLLH